MHHCSVQTPVALVYDIGDYEASLNKAMALADYAHFPDRRSAAAATGKRRGIGFACYIEACGLAPSKLAIELGAGVGLYESGEVRVNPTGSVTVFTARLRLDSDVDVDYYLNGGILQTVLRNMARGEM